MDPRIQKLRDKLNELEELTWQTENELSLVYEEILGDGITCPEVHECKDSPVRYCCYHEYDYDDCVFCHLPYERK